MRRPPRAKAAAPLKVQTLKKLSRWHRLRALLRAPSTTSYDLATARTVCVEFSPHQPRPIQAPGTDQHRRHGGDLPRQVAGRCRLREGGGAQAHPAPHGERPRVRRHVHRRGPHGGPAEPRQHLPDLRVRRRGGDLLPHPGAGGGQGPQADHGVPPHPQPPAAPQRGAARGGQGLRGAGLRTPLRRIRRSADEHRPPRRQPAEHPSLLRRRGEADRLRHRQGHGRG